MKWNPKQLARAYVEATDGKSKKDVEASAAAFVKFLADHHELPKWRDVARSIDAVWKEKYGVANVRVVSAHPLSAATRKALEKAVSGASVEETVDEQLIGGAKIQIDDRVLDASISGYLASLKLTLSS